MHIRNTDLNLLVILESLYRHRNLSRACEELGMTQSAISHALARLRTQFKDPLFVRISKGVAPTPFALSIQQEVKKFVQLASDLATRQDIFNPKVATGRIVLSTSDYFEVVFGSSLLKKISKDAPELQLSLRPTSGALPKKDLEEGTYHLAIAGFYEDLPEGFYRQKIFHDTYLTAYRKGHPKFKGPISVQKFYEAKHALITLQGDFKDNMARVIDGEKKRRVIQYGSSSFTGPAWIIAESDLLLTAPSTLIAKYQQYFPLVAQECPIDIKPLELEMVWHGVTHRNPMFQWLRNLIKEICRDSSAHGNRI